MPAWGTMIYLQSSCGGMGTATESSTYPSSTLEALQREALPMVTVTAIVKQLPVRSSGAQSILIDSRCKHEAPLIRLSFDIPDGP